jgi:hypothetical protein
MVNHRSHDDKNRYFKAIFSFFFARGEVGSPTYLGLVGLTQPVLLEGST